MKVRVTYDKAEYDYAAYSFYTVSQVEYPSIRQAAIACGRGPRIISRLMKEGGEAESKLGKIILVEAIDGETNSTSGEVRGDTNRVEENLPVGSLAVRGDWGWVKQALGKITAPVQWLVSKFH